MFGQKRVGNLRTKFVLEHFYNTNLTLFQYILMDYFTSHKDPWKLQFSKNVWECGTERKGKISQPFHRNYNSVPYRKSKTISAYSAEVSREESQS